MKLRLAISALVLGSCDDPHFTAAAKWLAGNLSCRFRTDARDALAATSDDVDPSLVVLLQSRPGQFTEAELATMQRRWPLTRFVAIAASWCEGEPRSGFVGGGIYRVPWTVAVDRLSAELSELLDERQTPSVSGLLNLPATATTDERLLANSRPIAQVPSVIAVAALRASDAEPLVDALASAGHTAAFWPLGRGALIRGIDAVVWDTFGCESRLAEFRRMLPPISSNGPIVAVADFPRPQDTSHLAELGVRRVIAKPLLIADLLTCLDAMLDRSGVESSQRSAVA